MVPFRGRLNFPQYLPGKRYKYGIKVFKICDPQGYTFNTLVYQGSTAQKNSKADIVMNLSEPYLDENRIVATDNFYTSLPLAKSLLDRQTYLMGDLRKNRKGLLVDVSQAKFKKGQIIGRKDQDEIVVAKWRDVRDVLLLSS
jgi:Transposase IS4